MRNAIVMLALAAVPLAAQPGETKVYKARHRPAIELVGVLPDNYRYSREFNTITLTGPAERIKLAETILQQYDTPPRQAEFTLRVLEAGAQPGPNDAADLVPAELKSMLRYARYGLRDSALLRGVEANNLTIALAGNLSGQMRFSVQEVQPAPLVSLSINIYGPPAISKVDGKEASRTPTLLQTTATMKSGETVVLGASKMQGGTAALIVLLTAKLLP